MPPPALFMTGKSTTPGLSIARSGSRRRKKRSRFAGEKSPSNPNRIRVVIRLVYEALYPPLLSSPQSQNPSSELKSSPDKASDYQSEETDSPKPKATPKPSHEAEKLAALLSGEIRRNSPNFRITPGQLRKWAGVADLMLRRDHRSYDEIAGIIRWCQADEFWRTNILSFDKLREKFDQLLLKAEPVRQQRPSEGISGDWPPELDAAVWRRCGGMLL